MKIPFIDTHTAGEPTRIFFDVPDLNLPHDLPAAVKQLQRSDDWLRRAALCEPRGNDVIVGALLLDARSPNSVSSVIFMNNVGYLGMCGHGTIGVAAALKHMGKLPDSAATLDTPVGNVELELAGTQVRIRNVPSYRFRKNVEITVEGRRIAGDVAWGGNWFFIADLQKESISLENIDELLHLSKCVRQELALAGITGAGGLEIDHVEFTQAIGPQEYRNFVLCPGGQYDRSPCGTGTSAKLACMAADQKLTEGEPITVTSVVGGQFQGMFSHSNSNSCDVNEGSAECVIRPTVSGEAFVTSVGEMVICPDDPFRYGFGEAPLNRETAADVAVRPPVAGDRP